MVSAAGPAGDSVEVTYHVARRSAGIETTGA
jgi:hypothetical protein